MPLPLSVLLLISCGTVFQFLFAWLFSSPLFSDLIITRYCNVFYPDFLIRLDGDDDWHHHIHIPSILSEDFQDKLQQPLSFPTDSGSTRSQTRGNQIKLRNKEVFCFQQKDTREGQDGPWDSSWVCIRQQTGGGLSPPFFLLFPPVPWNGRWIWRKGSMEEKSMVGSFTTSSSSFCNPESWKGPTGQSSIGHATVGSAEHTTAGDPLALWCQEV